MIDQPLIPLEMQRKLIEKEKLLKVQKEQMGRKLVNKPNQNFNRSVNASNDRYMVDALKKVRESKVTHHEDLTRINGTWVFNKSIER